MSKLEQGAGGVLFVTYGNGHIAKVAPVVKALQEKGVRCTVLAMTLGYSQSLKLGMKPIGYKDLLHLVDADAAMKYGRMLWPENQHPDVEELESCSYLGINYLEWVETYGEEEAAARYKKGGRRSFLPVRFMGTLIDYLQPSVVVSTSSPRSEQAAIEAAVQRGVPSLTMLDVFALPHDTYLQYDIYADRITAPSELAGQQLRNAGIDPSRIRVTGCPAYEYLRDPSLAPLGPELKRSLGWDGLKVILWAGTMEMDETGVAPEFYGTGFGVLVESALRDLVRTRADLALIVRYHPTQYHVFPDLGTQDRVYVSNPSADRLLPQLLACDTVIVQTSTVGYEAALLGKRLLTLSFSPRVINTENDFSRLGIAESVPSLGEMVPVLLAPRAEVPDLGGFPPPGSATERVCAEILGLMRVATA